MSRFYLVRRVPGGAWDPLRGLRDQKGWAAHAAFMNALTAEGVVQLGGAVGRREGFLLVMRAPDEATVRARLTDDPWTVAGLLEIERIQPWRLLLDARSDGE